MVLQVEQTVDFDHNVISFLSNILNKINEGTQVSHKTSLRHYRGHSYTFLRLQHMMTLVDTILKAFLLDLCFVN
jgi:O-phosphoseryl-tRNA(Cys) synthetase